MNLTILRNVMAAAVLALPAMAANSEAGAHLERIMTEARNTQSEAREISALLKSKNADLNAVSMKMEALERHAAALKQHVNEFEPAHPSMTDAQRAELTRLKQTAEILNIFVQNKKSMLASNDAHKNRALLRAKAEGIAKRASLVQTSAQKLRT